MVLAENIAKHYGQTLGKIIIQEFSDGEFEPVLEQSVRGARVFLIGSTFPPADNLLELLLMIDAAKRASAKNITVVIPYFGLARQDRKDKPRAPIGAKLVANLYCLPKVDFLGVEVVAPSFYNAEILFYRLQSVFYFQKVRR